jgi:hypothetical protein
MKKQLYGILLLAVAAFFATPAFAHHSFTSEFDINQPVTLQGTLSRLDWVNPHGWIYVSVKDKDGKVTEWACETGGPNALLRRGVRKTDFVLGTQITVKGFKAKSGLSVANARTVTLANGKELFAGSSGTGAPRDKADPTENY